MTRKLVLMTLLMVAVALMAGCGGGGGGTDPVNTTKYTLTGTVKDITTNGGVNGAIVSVGGHTATTNSSGSFSISLDSMPTVVNFTVDGETAGPASAHYYGNWANYNNHWYHVSYPAKASLPLPQINNGTNSLGTIYVLDQDQIPPIPTQ